MDGPVMPAQLRMLVIMLILLLCSLFEQSQRFFLNFLVTEFCNKRRDRIKEEEELQEALLLSSISSSGRKSSTVWKKVGNKELKLTSSPCSCNVSGSKEKYYRY
jgi:hypothetical protein